MDTDASNFEVFLVFLGSQEFQASLSPVCQGFLEASLAWAT
jgi:hypothetical protein